jgi:hypothetical protein
MLEAEQAIRKDVVRAIVELVTNSYDSYEKMGASSNKDQGSVAIEVQRRHHNSLIRVRDFARGMTDSEMDDGVGTLLAPTSGFARGRSIRGVWGRGLKDAILGLGYGKVVSVRDGSLNVATLQFRDGEVRYKGEDPRRATKTLLEQYGIDRGHGTVVDIVVSRDDVRVHQFDHMRRLLERHFELRMLLMDPQRRIVLRELDGSGKVRREIPLRYPPPKGVLVLKKTLDVPGFAAKVGLEVYRADEPLSTPGEERHYSEGGFLVTARDVVLDLTLLRFEGNEHASRLFGRISCDYLHDLLERDPPEPVVTMTRDGVNWKYPFTAALEKAVEAEIQPLVDEERKRSRAEHQGILDKELRARLEKVVMRLNEIAGQELGQLPGTDEGEEPPPVPEGGFGFVPEYASILVARPAGLTLRARVPDVVQGGSLVTVESDNPEVLVLVSQAIITQREDYPSIGEARIELEGRQVGAVAVITAVVDGLKAYGMVRVIAKRKKAEKKHERKKAGLFGAVRFDPNAEPKLRVRFDRDTSNIVISTRAPSVASYLGENGEGHNTPQGQVLVAELITEAMCREIARRGVESGRFLAPLGAETDAIQREYLRLQYKYAHLVHEWYVDATCFRGTQAARRKRGAPTRDERLARAVFEE